MMVSAVLLYDHAQSILPTACHYKKLSLQSGIGRLPMQVKILTLNLQPVHLNVCPDSTVPCEWDA